MISAPPERVAVIGFAGKPVTKDVKAVFFVVSLIIFVALFLKASGVKTDCGPFFRMTSKYSLPLNSFLRNSSRLTFTKGSFVVLIVLIALIDLNLLIYYPF